MDVVPVIRPLLPLIVSLVVTSFLMAPVLVAAPSTSIRVLQVQGEAELIRESGDGAVVTLIGGEQISEEDRIYTGLESAVVLIFGEDSRVVVRELSDAKISSFRVSGDSLQTRLMLKAGDMSADLIHGTELKSDFAIRTPTATCSVRGSGIDVNVVGGSTRMRQRQGTAFFMPSRGTGSNTSIGDQTHTDGETTETTQDIQRKGAVTAGLPFGATDREQKAAENDGTVAQTGSSSPGDSTNTGGSGTGGTTRGVVEDKESDDTIFGAGGGSTTPTDTKPPKDSPFIKITATGELPAGIQSVFDEYGAPGTDGDTLAFRAFTDDNVDGIYVKNANGVLPIVRVGDSAGGSGTATFTDFFGAGPSVDGDSAVFFAQVTVDRGQGSVFESGIFRIEGLKTANPQVQVVVRTGDLVPFTEGDIFNSFGTLPTVDQGVVFFYAQTTGNFPSGIYAGGVVGLGPELFPIVRAFENGPTDQVDVVFTDFKGTAAAGGTLLFAPPRDGPQGSPGIGGGGTPDLSVDGPFMAFAATTEDSEMNPGFGVFGLEATGTQGGTGDMQQVSGPSGFDIHTIANQASIVPGTMGSNFTGFTNPQVDVNALGVPTYAFGATGTGGEVGIYTASGPGPYDVQRVVDNSFMFPNTTDNFAEFREFSYSDGYTIFDALAGASLEHRGLFIATSDDPTPLIVTGDQISGQTVTDVFLSRFGADSQQFSFGATFSDNSQAIYQANTPLQAAQQVEQLAITAPTP